MKKEIWLYISMLLITALIIFALHCAAQAQTFSIISDYGSNDSNELKVSKLVNSMNPDFVITAGDNFHKTLTPLDSMIGKYFRRHFPNFFPVSGNHDKDDPVNYWLNDNNYLLNYKEYFHWLPGNKRYYTFSKGAIQFFMYNSDFGGQYSYCPNGRKVFEPHGIDSNSIQGQWLKSELARSQAKFKIVVMHYPPYFSFPYDYDTTTNVNCNGTPYRLQIKIDTLFKSLRLPFKSWGADMLISGHTHTGEHLRVNDFDYYIQLGGGAPLGNYFSNRNPNSKFFYKDKHGATLAKVNGDSVLFKLVNVANDTVYKFSIFPQKAMRVKVKVKAGEDSITLNVRSSQLPYQIISTAKRKLNANNEAVFYLPEVNLNQEYFLQVQHRNSISIWKRTKIQKFLDLSNPLNVHANNLDENGFMFSGDVNKDRTIDGSDYYQVDNDAMLFKSGYLQTDLNGNNDVDVSDMIIIENNIPKFVSEIMP